MTKPTIEPLDTVEIMDGYDFEGFLGERYDAYGSKARAFARSVISKATNIPDPPPEVDANIEMALAYANHFRWLETELSRDTLMQAWAIVEAARNATPDTFAARLLKSLDQEINLYFEACSEELKQ